MTIQGVLQKAAICIGSVFIARWGFHIVSCFHFYFLRRTGVKQYLTGADGSASKPAWAFITGSTSGIGKALALELAGHGFNIVLHGANEGRVEAAKRDLLARFPGRSVRTLVLDVKLCLTLSDPDLTTLLDGVAEKFSDIDVRILVNNVATPQFPPAERPPYERLENCTFEQLRTSVVINAASHLLITRAIFPNMLKHSASSPSPGVGITTPRCLIVNIGSIASRFPNFPSYAPSKAFTMRSADLLRLENMSYPPGPGTVGRDHIDVMAFDVMSVTETATITTAIDPVSAMTPSATSFARAMVRCMGYRGPDAARIYPWFPHAVFMGLVWYNLAPEEVREDTGSLGREPLPIVLRHMSSSALGKLEVASPDTREQGREHSKSRFYNPTRPHEIAMVERALPVIWADVSHGSMHPSDPRMFSILGFGTAYTALLVLAVDTSASLKRVLRPLALPADAFSSGLPEEQA
ncbi:uncharacterized protein B0I36DRAFT_430116 [Microdochium trichocladiopsis]|uniref:Uncharacterized protein n=1 Tax=Microdochium trichocladiopsis TaxID=1682393 RepID=A0A9P8YAC4_9PEZI|nr:uncharacterized protein B0I36DRAFT_430116 [Microdochium trichocladiopsis]KAH7032714.1 hypothetical protein B0I36DRAFT_430116 [Microdochium trichocladiopsis]